MQEKFVVMMVGYLQKNVILFLKNCQVTGRHVTLPHTWNDGDGQ